VFSVEHASLPATCDCGVIVKDGGRFGSLALHHRDRHRRRLRPYAEQVDCLQRSNQQLQQLWGSRSGGRVVCNGGAHDNSGGNGRDVAYNAFSRDCCNNTDCYSCEISDSLCALQSCEVLRCSVAGSTPKQNHLRVMVRSSVLLDIVCTCMDELNCCRRVRNRLLQRGQVRRCCVLLVCFTRREQRWQSFQLSQLQDEHCCSIARKSYSLIVFWQPEHVPRQQLRRRRNVFQRQVLTLRVTYRVS
jgi:hypothetical protein